MSIHLLIMDTIVKGLVKDFFTETSCYDENNDEENYDEWASNYRHTVVDDKASEMGTEEKNMFLCAFGITRAIQLYICDWGIDKEAPTEAQLVYTILYDALCEKTSYEDYMKWVESRKLKTPPVKATEGECPICYEAYGEKPDGSYLCKDGKDNSGYKEECKHYVCVECCKKLVKDVCRCCDTVKCPLCREDWTDWIFSHYGEESEAEVSDDDEED